MARYCLMTWLFTPASHSSADSAVGSWKSGTAQFLRLVDRGQVLKNSTPAEKSLIDEAGVGSSTMPPGTEADEHAERAEFRDGELDREAANAGHREAALHAHEEYAVHHRRRGVEAGDHRRRWHPS